MKLLIVDDEVDIVESIRNILKPADYNCRITTNPMDVIGLFQKYDFDVLVTDIMMAGMNGKELIKKVREINTVVKIIVVSAFCDEDTVNSIKKEQIFSFFRKPLDVREFINKLREIEKQLDEEKKQNLGFF